MKKIFSPMVMILISFCWLSCSRKEESNTVQVKAFPDWEAIANKLMERSNLAEGEKVILMAHPGSFDPLIPLLAEKITQAGAAYLGTFSVDSSSRPASWETDFVKQAKGKSKEELTNHLMQVDLGMMLPGANPDHFEYAAMQEENLLKLTAPLASSIKKFFLKQIILSLEKYSEISKRLFGMNGSL
jgi:hypothetical protein